MDRICNSPCLEVNMYKLDEVLEMTWWFELSYFVGVNCMDRLVFASMPLANYGQLFSFEGRAANMFLVELF